MIFKWITNKIFNKEKMVAPAVNISEMDLSQHTPENCGIVIPLKNDTPHKIKHYGPSISKPKWYQPWRWYLIPRYYFECYMAVKDFEKDFGKPGQFSKEQVEYAARNAFYPPERKLYCIRTENDKL